MRSGYGRLVNRRIVLSLVDDRAIDGVLVGHSGPLLFVKGATLLEPGHDPVSMDGEVVIERINVDFIQAL